MAAEKENIFSLSRFLCSLNAIKYFPVEVKGFYSFSFLCPKTVGTAGFKTCFLFGRVLMASYQLVCLKEASYLYVKEGSYRNVAIKASVTGELDVNCCFEMLPWSCSPRFHFSFSHACFCSFPHWTVSLRFPVTPSSFEISEATPRRTHVCLWTLVETTVPESQCCPSCILGSDRRENSLFREDLSQTEDLGRSRSLWGRGNSLFCHVGSHHHLPKKT